MDAAFIKDGTITNAKIGNATIDTAKIVSLTASKITAGDISVGNYIQSTGFITGSSGWKIGGNGVAEFAAASIRGQLTASQINSNGLSVKDTSGNIILNAGTGVFSGTTSASNVSGLGGFAFISSITSANISTYIAGAAIGTAYISNAAITNALIVDAAITTAKIGDAQITSAKIGDAQITSAKIGDAQITNAKIGTAAVDTLTIAGQAVTVPNSAFTAGEYRNSANATWQDAQSIAITTSGSRVYVASAGLALGGDSSEGGFNPRFRLVRDSTELMQGGPSMSYSDTPSAGTYTYKLQVISDGTGTVFTYAGISNRSLFTIETKR
jgi:hypothetical protein